MGEAIEKQRATEVKMCNGIRVEGNTLFVARTEDALKLLERSREFKIAKPYLGIIRQGKLSEMKAQELIPAYEVGEITWQYSYFWFASTIAHDAFHSLLYRQAKEKEGGQEPPVEAWTGTEAERKCIEFQLRVLKELTTDQYLIKHLEKMKENPTHHIDPDRNW